MSGQQYGYVIVLTLDMVRRGICVSPVVRPTQEGIMVSGLEETVRQG